MPVHILNCINFPFDQNQKPLLTDIYPQISKCQTLQLHLPGIVPFGAFTLNPDNVLLKGYSSLQNALFWEHKKPGYQSMGLTAVKFPW